MAYPYNPKIAPAIGNGLGGFPQKAVVASSSGAVATATKYYPIVLTPITLSASNGVGTKTVNRANYGSKFYIKNGNNVAIIFVQYESSNYYFYFSKVDATTGYYISRNLNINFGGFSTIQDQNNSMSYLSFFNFTLNDNTSTIYGVTDRGIVRASYDGDTIVNVDLLSNTYNYSGSTTKGSIVSYTGAILKATPSNAYPILIDNTTGDVYVISITNELYVILEKRNKSNLSVILNSTRITTVGSTVRDYYGFHLNQTSNGDIVVTMTTNLHDGGMTYADSAINVYIFNSNMDIVTSYVSNTVRQYAPSITVSYSEGFSHTLISESKNYIGIICVHSSHSSISGSPPYVSLNILYSKTSYTNLHPDPKLTLYTQYFPQIHQRCGKYFLGTNAGNEIMCHDYGFAIARSASTGYLIREIEPQYITLNGKSDVIGCFKNITLTVFQDYTFQIKYDIQPYTTFEITTTVIDGTNQTYTFYPVFYNSNGKLFSFGAVNTTSINVVSGVFTPITILESA